MNVSKSELTFNVQHEAPNHILTHIQLQITFLCFHSYECFLENEI